jgi:hypothetical protein
MLFVFIDEEDWKNSKYSCVGGIKTTSVISFGKKLKRDEQKKLVRKSDILKKYYQSFVETSPPPSGSLTIQSASPPSINLFSSK